MKRILATTSIAALAMVGFAGSANAAPADRACFGQVHKRVNAGEFSVKNVGELVKAQGGGQAKNALAKTIPCD